MTFVLFVMGKLFALSAGGYYFKYLSRPYRLVYYLVAIALFAECYGYYLAIYLRQPNVWMFNLYMPVEFFLMMPAGISLLKHKRLKQIFILLLIVFACTWLWSMLRYSIYVFGARAMMTGCAVSACLFLVLLVDNYPFDDAPVLSQPVFWLSISCILYYACDIPYMGLYNYLLKHYPEVADDVHYINVALDIIRYPLAGISFILLGRQRCAVIKTA